MRRDPWKIGSGRHARPRHEEGAFEHLGGRQIRELSCTDLRLQRNLRCELQIYLQGATRHEQRQRQILNGCDAVVTDEPNGVVWGQRAPNEALDVNGAPRVLRISRWHFDASIAHPNRHHALGGVREGCRAQHNPTREQATRLPGCLLGCRRVLLAGTGGACRLLLGRHLLGLCGFPCTRFLGPCRRFRREQLWCRKCGRKLQRHHPARAAPRNRQARDGAQLHARLAVNAVQLMMLVRAHIRRPPSANAHWRHWHGPIGMQEEVENLRRVCIWHSYGPSVVKRDVHRCDVSLHHTLHGGHPWKGLMRKWGACVSCLQTELTQLTHRSFVLTEPVRGLLLLH